LPVRGSHDGRVARVVDQLELAAEYASLKQVSVKENDARIRRVAERRRVAPLGGPMDRQRTDTKRISSHRASTGYSGLTPDLRRLVAREARIPLRKRNR
jgi:hypothetical protein